MARPSELKYLFVSLLIVGLQYTAHFAFFYYQAPDLTLFAWLSGQGKRRGCWVAGGTALAGLNEEDHAMINKRNEVAIAVLSTALLVGSLGVPSFAANSQGPGYDTCYTIAVERGSGPFGGGHEKAASQHRAFMEQCMAGKIPLGAAAVPSAVESTSALPAALKHINRHSMARK
jgi:hypothetical protein